MLKTLQSSNKYLLEPQKFMQRNTYILEFQEIWQRRLPKHLWRDPSESVPLHLLSFIGDVNVAHINGTLLVRNRPKTLIK